MTRVLHVIGALALLGGVAPVRAQSKDAAPVQSSDALIANGVALRKQGRNAEALSEFQRAYALSPSARAAAQIALAQQVLADWLAAEAGLVDALALRDDAWIKHNQAPLTAALATVRAHLGSLRIESNVAQTSVALDARVVGSTPLRSPVRVVAGSYTLTAQADGYLPDERQVSVPPGSELSVRLELRARPNAEPTPSAAAPVAAQPVSAPAAPAQLDAAWRKPAATPPANDNGAGLRTAATVSLVAGGVFLAGGITANVVRAHDVGTYNDPQFCPAPVEQRCGRYRQQADLMQTYAIAGYAAAGALLVASLVLFIAAPDAPSPARQWGAAVSRDGAYFVVSGQL